VRLDLVLTGGLGTSPLTGICLPSRSDPDEPEQPTGAHHWLVPLDEEADPGTERSKLSFRVDMLGSDRTLTLTHPTLSSARLPILNNDLVRLRITASKFQEHEPGPPRDRIKVVDGIAVPIAENEDEMLPGYLLEVRPSPLRRSSRWS
jgi:hypothetical protein